MARIDSLYVGYLCYSQGDFQDFHDLVAVGTMRSPLIFMNGTLHYRCVCQDGETTTFEMKMVPFREPGKRGAPGRPASVSKKALPMFVDQAKHAASQIARNALECLKERFPRSPIVDALSMVHPKFWLDVGGEGDVPPPGFQEYQAEIIEKFGTPKLIDGVVIDPPVCAEKLMFQAPVFIRWARGVVKADGNISLSQMWAGLAGDPTFDGDQWVMVARIFVVTVAVSVEDERSSRCVQCHELCAK